MRRSQWTRGDGERLLRARERRGDSQTQCADALTKLGAASVTQGTVSSWERAKTGPVSATTLRAIEAYCADEDPEKCGRVNEGSHEHLRGTSSETLGPAAIGSPGVEERFSQVIAGLTGDRLLSNRQRQLVDGLIHRLRQGPSMSAEDGATARSLLRILGLADD